MYKRLITLFALLLYASLPSISYGSTPLSPASFEDLKGWSNEHAKAVRPVLLNSCKKLSPKTFTSSPISSGTYQQWQTLCEQLAEESSEQLKNFFENKFSAYQVSPKQKGLFTGYFSPVYEGRLQKEPGFETPLLKYPDPHGSDIKNNDTRRIIEEKIKAVNFKDSQVLVWIKNAADKFFLQIQGSGDIQLKDGSILHAAYAGNNKQPYVPIGRVLKNEGELDKVTMGSIRTWLVTHPDKQQALFNQNPRYIFFREGHTGAITAQGVSATPQRTLAVDPDYIPYGTLLWVDTELTVSKTPYRQMMVAQDTGSAIKGAVRGDIYMGTGSEAASLAGPQQAAGKLYVLLPQKKQ